MPSMALPIEVTSASCKYSKKKRELVVQWPRHEPKVADVTLDAAVEKAQIPEADAKAPGQNPASEETASDSTESPATEKAVSEETSDEESKFAEADAPQEKE